MELLKRFLFRPQNFLAFLIVGALVVAVILLLDLISAPAHAATVNAHRKVSTTISVQDCRKTIPAEFLATHQVDFCWEHPGADPAFKNRTDAMAHRREIFAKFAGLSGEPGLVDYAVAQTEKPGTLVRIVNRNWFNDMTSSGGKVHHGVLVDFLDTVKGITQEIGGIFLYAEMWEFNYHGKRYKIFLPLICFNWSDRVYAIPVAAPPPPPVDDCVEIAAKMNAGDTILFGIASDQNLPLSHCTAQQKPGETHFETDFREEPNCLPWIVCTLEKPAADLGKPLLAGPRETFTATQNGWYIVRLPRAVVDNPDVWHEIFCLHFHDWHNSWGEYVASRNFTDGKAFIVFHWEKADMIRIRKADGTEVPWAGTALEWRFLPFLWEPNHR